MPDPTAQHFFLLDYFPHSTLWDLQLPVWTALSQLKNYFTTYDLGKIQIPIPSDVQLIHPETISIGANTILEPGVMIKGPCIIGDNCKISHGAYLRENVIIGNHTKIGHCAEVKHSVILNHSCITHFCYVGDSLIGNQVNLGAGVKCANLRLDRNEIHLYWNGIKMASGCKKLGAIIGDGVQIGCNSVLNPGTLIEKGCLIGPLQNVGKTVFFKSKELV